MDSSAQKEILIKKLSDYVHNLYETQKIVAPMLMGFNPEKNEVVFIPLEFSNDEEKEACFRTVEVCLWLFECKSYFFHTEAWMTHVMTRETEKFDPRNYPRPENDPNRVEILQMGYADTGNHKEGKVYEIKRTPGIDIPTLTPRLPNGAEMRGRMFSFLEKSFTSAGSSVLKENAREEMREILRKKGIAPRPFSVIEGGKK